MALVEYEVRDKLACITLNRPEKMNAINHEMSERIFALFDEMERDPGVWGCLITGNGKAFSSGHDLTERRPKIGKSNPSRTSIRSSWSCTSPASRRSTGSAWRAGRASRFPATCA